MTECQRKAKTALHQITLFSPSKKLSSNEINSWNETHDKKAKPQWTSSKKKPKGTQKINNIENLKKDLSVNLEKTTPSTCRDSELSKLEYQLINTKQNISEFKLPEFEGNGKRVNIGRPRSITNKLSTRTNWNKISNPPTGRRQTKQMIEKEIREHLEEIKKPLLVRKCSQPNRFLSLISKAGLR